MNVEALNCPNCGAGVESDKTQCEFCRTRLKTVACPRCFRAMFVGSKFCGLCGAMAAPVAISLDDDQGDCPRCRKGLEHMTIGETDLRGCPECDGLWMDISTFEAVCADREKQSAVLGHLQERSSGGLSPTKIKYVPCPDCGTLMNRNNFAKASGVIVDICKQHGVWFDADELPAIIDFIRRGGMEITRQREKLDIEAGLARLREADRRREQYEMSFGGRTTWTDDDADAGVRGFIQRLFE